MQVIFFTDIVASTRTTRELGDYAAHQLIRVHNQVVRESFRECEGAEIKHTGDGIMGTFRSASAAVECAIRVQKRLQAESETNDHKLAVSIGINAGEPIVDGGDLFGIAVQVAARLCDRAKGGEILVSEVIKLLLAGKHYEFSPPEELMLKGLDDHFRAYKVSWQ